MTSIVVSIVDLSMFCKTYWLPLYIKETYAYYRLSIAGFKPLTPRAEQLARTCVLPLLLAGVYGAPNMKEGYLAEYLKNLVLQSSVKQGAWTPVHTPELIDAVRFLWYYSDFSSRHHLPRY